MGLFWKSKAEKEAERQQAEKEAKQLARELAQKERRRRDAKESQELIAEISKVIESVERKNPNWEAKQESRQSADNCYRIHSRTSEGYMIEIRTCFHTGAPYHYGASVPSRGQGSEIRVREVKDGKENFIYWKEVHETRPGHKEACMYLKDYVENIALPIIKKEREEDQKEKRDAKDRFFNN